MVGDDKLIAMSRIPGRLYFICLILLSCIRKGLRDGYQIEDASWFRPNSELAPTFLNSTRTVRRPFLGAERNLLNNKGLWP